MVSLPALTNVIMQIGLNIEPLELTDIVDFASGIFAVLLMALSLLAYRNTRTKRLLFVSAAFGLFALRTIVARLDTLIPEAQSTLIEVTLALTGFAILSLFFLAIAKRPSDHKRL
ncbi:MAG: hypothetical protein AUH71_01035 [Thaumarchaeota archaeon 13_1_40CM_4_48_7]|nr:MAG: hypothetical protein AUH71_01035 [Thaumarchaeota archaeon 13_1_40CM_4_48_7]